jgi:hypothetical protein
VLQQKQQAQAQAQAGTKKPVVSILISGHDLRNVMRLKGELEVFIVSNSDFTSSSFYTIMMASTTLCHSV